MSASRIPFLTRYAVAVPACSQIGSYDPQRQLTTILTRGAPEPLILSGLAPELATNSKVAGDIGED